MANTGDWSRDLFPGTLEMMILESLRRQPDHGYALVQHIQQRSNDILQVEEGSLYPALQRLLKERLVKAEWTTSPLTNRRVRIYEITRSGLRHLEGQVGSLLLSQAGEEIACQRGLKSLRGESLPPKSTRASRS